MVLDASAMIEMLLRTPKGLQVRRHVSVNSDLHAPHLIDIEIAHALRQLVRSQQIDAVRGIEALEDFRDIKIARYPHEGFLRRIWSLRNNLTAYDAAYVVLAEVLGVNLITCDKRLASAPGNNVTIELIS